MYITDGETNATLKRGDQPEDLTAERAQELLAERREYMASPEGLEKAALRAKRARAAPRATAKAAKTATPEASAEPKTGKAKKPAKKKAPAKA
jgi:DNA topoisomerase-1